MAKCDKGEGASNIGGRPVTYVLNGPLGIFVILHYQTSLLSRSISQSYLGLRVQIVKEMKVNTHEW